MANRIEELEMPVEEQDMEEKPEMSAEDLAMEYPLELLEEAVALAKEEDEGEMDEEGDMDMDMEEMPEEDMV